MPLGRSRLASRLNYQHLSVTSGLYPFAGSPLHSKHRFNKPHHHKQMWHQEHRLVSVLFLKTHPNFPYLLQVQSLLLWVSVTAVVVWTRFIAARGAVQYVVPCAICDDAMQISAIQIDIYILRSHDLLMYCILLVCPSLSLVRFGQLLRYADKRIVNIMKVYIEINNLQVELIWLVFDPCRLSPPR